MGQLKALDSVLEARASGAKETSFVVRISSRMDTCFRFESNVDSGSTDYTLATLVASTRLKMRPFWMRPDSGQLDRMGGWMRHSRRLFFVGAFANLIIGSGVTGGDAAFAQIAADTDLEDNSSTFSGPDYRVNSGDQLEISVWREEELQREVTVLPDGTISFPLVGTIKAAGKTAAQLEQEISSKLESNFVDGDVPDVTVTVASTSGLQFSVIGQVRSPGTFTPGRYVTILEALSFSGGVTEFASLSNIVVVRKSGETLTVIPVSLSNVLRSKSVSAKDVSALPVIRSGDTIIVP